MSQTQQLANSGEQEQQTARGFDSYGLLACLVISVFLIVWITLASKSLNFGTFIFLLALPWVLLRAGAIVTATLRFPSFFALDFLLSYGCLSCSDELEIFRATLTLGSAGCAPGRSRHYSQ